MASLENRSVSNLIEVMADERWKRLAEQAKQQTNEPQNPNAGFRKFAIRNRQRSRIPVIVCDHCDKVIFPL